ncbi:Ubiquitin-like-specific protease 1D [Acorus calamus]|uniref:Ubiquitin-like-specific protease 1D n=1 Tax=Acorus calamus TaxID=4465 RepID=A0AAV9FJI9_ACOCL|nr:Ubiquitin-like-specific protease 1D [Acorus calamus]
MHRDRMETGIASRIAPFRHSSRFCNNTDKVDKNRHDGDHMGVSCSSFYSTTTRQSFSRNSEKRRLSPVRGSPNLSFSKSRKVQDVVLLDEEDMQTTPPTEQEDGSDKWKEVKIYYPSRDHSEAVEICPGDLKCLDPEAYISSPIMNYYILYLQKSAVVPLGKRKDDYHFFNTYLYKKLEETMSCKSSEKDAFFKKLRRWWKGVNIFQKAYIFLPIHRDLHWSLAIICIPAKEDESGPIVLHLDSLGLHTSKFIFDNIEGYLKQEWEFLMENDNALPDLPMSDRIWRNLPRRIERRIITVPQQKNDYDCGLFVLYFIERFIEMAPERVRKKDLDMFGKKWFHPEEASALRRKLLELLTEEFASARAPNVCAESPPCSSESSEDKNGKCDVDEVKS